MRPIHPDTVGVGISISRVGSAKVPTVRSTPSQEPRYPVSGLPKPPLSTGNRACLYTRVSREEQAEGHSLDGQLSALRSYCNQHGYRVARIMPPESGSGADWDRPVFQRLLYLASRAAFDVLVVWKRDRYARDAVGAGFYERILRGYGVRIESVATGPMDDTPANRFITQVFDAHAELERATIRERCKLGRDMAARKGLWPLESPFGYRKEIPREASRLLIEPAEASLMRDAYDECLRGANRIRIAQLLGIGPSSTMRRLQSPTYKGEAQYLDIRVPCPAIVSPETWQSAQGAIASRYAQPGRRPGPYLLRDQARGAA